MNSVTVVGEVEEFTTANTSEFTSETSYSIVDSSPWKAFSVLRNVIGATGIVTNAFVIFVMVGFMEMKSKTTNILIVNQSFADLAASILIVTPMKIGKNVNHDSAWDQLVCRFWSSGYFLYVALGVSTNNILALTAERYLAVIYPVVHKVSFTARKTGVIVAATWLFVIVYDLLMLIPTTDIVDGYCLPYQVWSSMLASQIVPMTVSLSIEYLGPVLIIAFCYGRMFLSLKRKCQLATDFVHSLYYIQKIISNFVETSISHNVVNVPGRRDNQLSANDKATSTVNQYDSAMRNILKTMTIIVIMFIICVTPAQVLWSLDTLGVVKIDFRGWVYLLSTLAQLCNIFVNPLVYAVKYKDFKTGCGRMLHTLLQHRRLISSQINTITVRTADTSA